MFLIFFGVRLYCFLFLEDFLFGEVFFLYVGGGDGFGLFCDFDVLVEDMELLFI